MLRLPSLASKVRITPVVVRNPVYPLQTQLVRRLCDRNEIVLDLQRKMTLLEDEIERTYTRNRELEYKTVFQYSEIKELKKENFKLETERNLLERLLKSK
jgi:predicted nuclease with TOPRIM domain